MIELEFDHFWNEVHMIAFQTLPWSCRKEKMGARVNIKGIKEKIQAASYPSGLSNLFFRQLEELLNMRIERVRSALTLTFANIGQIFIRESCTGCLRKNRSGNMENMRFLCFTRG